MEIAFTCNDKKITLNVSPVRRLVDILRDDLVLKSTRARCRTGSCGSCLVLLNGKLVNSCLIPAFRLQGRKITTVEGLSADKTLAKIQRICSEKEIFCSEQYMHGVIMAIAALLKTTKNPRITDIKEALAGNICPLTAYKTLSEGIELISKSRSK